MLLSRYALEQFHPLNFVGLRFLVAWLLTILFYVLVVRKNRPWSKDRRLWIHASIFGILGSVLPMTLVVWSLQYQSSGVSSVLTTTVPALTVVLAHFFLPDESLNRRKALGVVLAFAGALVLTLRGETGLVDVTQADPLGYTLVFTAVLAASCMIIYARRYIQGYDTFDVTSVQIISSTIFILPLMVFTVGLDLQQVNAGGVIALLISATAGTFGVVFVGYYIIDNFSATAASMSSYVVPIIVAIGGVLFLGEQITTGILGGFVCIVVGLWLINEINTDRDPVKSA
jgi:drug/metabolite transporter (DMT)-like permease